MFRTTIPSAWSLARGICVLSALGLAVAFSGCSSDRFGVGKKKGSDSAGDDGAPVLEIDEYHSAALTCDTESAKRFTYVRRLSVQEYFHIAVDTFKLDMTAMRGFFPADSNVGGFVNSYLGNDTSALHVSKYAEAAEKMAQMLYAADWFQAMHVTPCGEDDDCHAERIGAYGSLFVRGLLDVEEERTLRDLYTGMRADGKSIEAAIKAVLTVLFQSPRFLYKVEPAGEPTPLSILNRLSFFLWQSAPDPERAAEFAAKDKLSREELRELLKDMFVDGRTRRSFRTFVRQWFALDGLATAEKDPELFPDVDRELLAELGESVVRTLEHLAFSGEPLKSMFTSKILIASPRVAQFYGLDPKGEGLQEYAFKEKHRRGVMAHAGLLAMMADRQWSSPIRRGRFVATRFLCRVIPPPPPDTPVASLDTAGKSPREILEAHTENPACASCHKLMDGIGFGLENFDAVGRYRETYENGIAIDPKTAVELGGKMVRFDSAAKLGSLLAKSDEVMPCFAHTFILFARGHTLDNENSCELDRLQRRLSDDMSYFDLIESIVTSEVLGR